MPPQASAATRARIAATSCSCEAAFTKLGAMPSNKAVPMVNDDAPNALDRSSQTKMERLSQNGYGYVFLVFVVDRQDHRRRFPRT